MDSVSIPDLARIFDRLSHTIQWEGATSAWLIDERLKEELQRKMMKARTAKNRAAFNHYMKDAEQLDKLIEHGFPARIIREANAHPRGLFALSLLYGTPEARRRIFVFRKAHVGKLGYPRRIRELRSVPWRRR